MKKTLLLLFFFLSVTLYAQPPGMLPDYSLCDVDNSNDGYTTFDLNSTISMVLSDLNPATHTITFHQTDTDSANNTNVISNPSSYINILPNTQLIGVRIVDNTTSQVYLTAMNLVVVPLPIANPAQLTYYYDPFELNMYYYLLDADWQIAGGIAGLAVTYYHTLADAINGTNPIDTNINYVPTATPGVEIVYARVTNNTTSCYSVTTLTLNTISLGACQTPTNLVASQITDTSFALSWTSSGTVGYYYICIVPQGMPPSNLNLVITSDGGIPYVYTGLIPSTCYSVYTKANCNPSNPNYISQWSAPLNICMPNCANSGECAEALVLNAFVDNNNNGVKDSGEENFNAGNFVYQVNDLETNQYGSTNSSSYYIFDSNPINSYDISFALNNNLIGYYSSATTFSNITLPTGSGINYLYFPVTVIQTYIDSSVSLYPQSSPRPGFEYQVSVFYSNHGLSPLANGTITFTKDPNVTINSVTQAGTTNTPTGFTYDFTNLLPGQNRYLDVYLQVPTIPTVNIGDYLSNTATLQTDGSDANIANNTSTLSQIVVGSYDPNEKSESHGGRIGLDTFTNNDYLYYTINFENTGTASAEFIRVEDALDARLDESTFEMINASHTVNTKREGNQLTWHFYTINLPPTITNPNDSHGYVYFKIKPKAGYAVGDIIPNTASIYFDYNPAIVTNTFNTELFTTLTTSNFGVNNLVISPNPANTNVQINIQNTSETINNIIIVDILGKTIKRINNVSSNQNTIDVSNLSEGVYFVTITTENNLKQVKKLIIE